MVKCTLTPTFDVGVVGPPTLTVGPFQEGDGQMHIVGDPFPSLRFLYQYRTLFLEFDPTCPIDADATCVAPSVICLRW